ncbi:MAG TPA: hypothetical protein VHD90_02340 [Phototrophicaceae bacterium]|nr:hypothetical protein [Phototrophicaceae bacterium]
MYGPGWGWRRRWGWRRPMWGPYFGFGFPGCGCLFLLLFLALGACWFFTGGFFHPFFYYYR